MSCLGAVVETSCSALFAVPFLVVGGGVLLLFAAFFPFFGRWVCVVLSFSWVCRWSACGFMRVVLVAGGVYGDIGACWLVLIGVVVVSLGVRESLRVW